jgi:hypothetical protein
MIDAFLKSRLADECQARGLADKRAHSALVRAERAEQQVRRLTADLDRAHRLIDRLSAREPAA